MNKILVACASLGAILVSTASFAGDFTQYVAGRAAFVDLRNDADNRAVFNGGGTLFPNTIVDGKLSDNVGGLRVAYGIQKDMPIIHGGLRGELEYGYNTKAEEKGTTGINAWGQDVNLDWEQRTRSMTVMVNGYYDLDTKTNFVPYIGGGLGYAHLKTSASGFIRDLNVGVGAVDVPFSGAEDKGNFAWNLQAGLAYKITQNWVSELGYRYTHLGYTKSSSTADNGSSSARYKIDTHEVSVGLRYHF